VKRATRRDAPAILHSEAKILAYLQTVADNERYIVPFHGILDSSTIVLTAIPYTLDNHIRTCAVNATKNFSTSTMYEPVIGSISVWLEYARQLITALAWLHEEAGVVHGDIKPGNILLSPTTTLSGETIYTPYLTDFSSSQRMDSDTVTPNTLSAVTREYTAPELLTSAVLRDPTSTATPASDVFSLAVTLLVAATGQLLVYPGSVFQRQVMATQGWLILQHVRSGAQGTRVPRLGVVEKVLERAVLKKGMGRIRVLEWLALVEVMVQDGPTKS
jgi:serine/threonine protein kinase